MFVKPFKVKSHSQLKTSEKKKLRTQLSQTFPRLTSDEIADLVPLKDDVSIMRVFCHKGETANVYMVNGEPIAYAVELKRGSVIFPSVYLCWQYPQVALGTEFVTTTDVLGRLQQGADLMMPGVIYRGQLTQYTFGTFEAGTPAVVISNGVVIAVGSTALSSTDIYMAGGHGKAVLVSHVVGDHLWAAGSKTQLPRQQSQDTVSTPNSLYEDSSEAGGAPYSSNYVIVGGAATNANIVSRSFSEMLRRNTGSSNNDVIMPVSMSTSNVAGAAAGGVTGCIKVIGMSGSSTGMSNNSMTASTPDDDLSYSTTTGSCTTSDATSTELEEQTKALKLQQEQLTAPPEVLNSDPMDALLLHCFLKAIQQSKGKLPLPLLTSNFYRLHVMPACPDGYTLDIKKTTFKKLSKFLKTMEEKGVIKVKEALKGVENITEVTYDHPMVTSFRFNKSETSVKVESSEGAFVPPTLDEVYQVSGDTIEFFRACGRSKGEVLDRSEVRQAVTQYIKAKKLVDEATRLVSIEPPLQSAIIAPKEGYVRHLKWDQVFSRLLGKMAPAVRISRPGYPTEIKKGSIKPIEMAVVKRAGNKKVTLVYNVSNFGISENEFAKQVQVIAAASTSVGAAEHKPQGTTQVLVQGNATAEVAKLLLETYNIPKKYIKGLELIPKAKKGK